jgi:hypothetical protein
MNRLPKAPHRTALVLLILFGLVPGREATAASGAREKARPAAETALAGRVLGASGPVAAATVFAYEVATYAMQKVETDRKGRFLFGELPAGMYKIVAYKQGFAPAVEPILRRRPDDGQFVELRMRDEEPGDVRGAEDYWSLRSRVPVDVLRQINAPELFPETATPGTQTRLADGAAFAGEVFADGGVEQLGELYGEAQLTTAEVDLEGAVGDLEVGLNGRFEQLSGSRADAGAPSPPDGEVRALAVELRDADRDSRLNLATNNSEIAGLPGEGRAPVGFENYQLIWSGQVGGEARSRIAARYTEESNYHQNGQLNPLEIPAASRTLDVEGSYRTRLGENTSLRAGVAYRQLQGELANLPGLAAHGEPPTGFALDDGSIADESLSLYGVAGSRIQPKVLVEYGLFSSVREGGWSLMPHGGMVVELGSGWRARAAASKRLEEQEEGLYPGFRSAFYHDRSSCQQAGEACYEVTFTRGDEGASQVLVGAVHREFAETLRLYFSEDFFDRLESLFVVDGDRLQDLQFRMVRRISPRVLAKLESNFASGGGGIFYATDDLVPYENQVRYLVTSLDTQFQNTSTGVFVAFHHLEQNLRPSDRPSERGSEIEVQRLQLMLTQDLNLLANVASNWAVRLNVELSRGATPYTLTEDDELRKKLTGGISVSF